MELTKANALNALKTQLKDCKAIYVSHGQWNNGCGHTAKLDHYYTKIGDVELTSKTIGYQDADKVVRDALKELKGLSLVENTISRPTGYRDCFGIPRTNDYTIVSKVVKIVPSKAFVTLNKWIVKHGGTELRMTDLYIASACKKRSSVSVSRHYYFAENERYCTLLLGYLKSHKSSKDTITMEIATKDEYDGESTSRYEYEVYGTRTSYLHATIKTPTGRTKAETNEYTIPRYNY